MKRFLAVVAILSLVAMPAMAERIVVPSQNIYVSPVDGAVLGTPTQQTMPNGQLANVLTADLTNATKSSNRGPGTVVYSNNPLLGTSTIPTPTLIGPGGTLIANTFVGLDWVAASAAWTDYITLTGAGTISTITYLYTNGAGSHTHTIILGAGPAIPTISGPFTGIVPFASVVIPGLPGPGGILGVTITGLNIPVPSSLYIGYEDAFGAGPGSGSSFWFTGGFPLIGASGDQNAFWIPGSYSYAVQGPFVFGGPYPTYAYSAAAHANILQTLVTPEPMTIGLVAAGGLLALRRRRAA